MRSGLATAEWAAYVSGVSQEVLRSDRSAMTQMLESSHEEPLQLPRPKATDS